MAKASTPAVPTVTYLGDSDFLDYRGFHLVRNQAVPVDIDTATFLSTNEYFKVDGLPSTDPADTPTIESAVAEERAKSAQALADAQAGFDKQIADLTESFKADAAKAQAANQAAADAMLAKQAEDQITIANLKAQIADLTKASIETAKTVTASADTSPTKKGA